MAHIPVDQHPHHHSGVQLPRIIHIQLRYNNPHPHHLHKGDPLPLHLQEPHLASQDAPARTRAESDQREISRQRERHETPAGINGTLLSRRSQPHVGMPPHASADARPRGDVLVLPLCDRAPRRVIPLGKGPRSPRRHNIMDSRHSAHIIHIRQPHKPLLPPHDHHKHRVHLPQHADPGILRYARNEMDDVPHAADVPVHLQQLRRRPQLLLPPVTPHHNHHDIHLPQGRIRGEDASQDG